MLTVVTCSSAISSQVKTHHQTHTLTIFQLNYIHEKRCYPAWSADRAAELLCDGSQPYTVCERNILCDEPQPIHSVWTEHPVWWATTHTQCVNGISCMMGHNPYTVCEWNTLCDEPIDTQRMNLTSSVMGHNPYTIWNEHSYIIGCSLTSRELPEVGMGKAFSEFIPCDRHCSNPSRSTNIFKLVRSLRSNQAILTYG